MKVECTHTPPEPRAMQPQRGQPDLRDKITLTITVSNPSQTKTIRACTIKVFPYEPGSTSPAGWNWTQDIPELPNGGGQQGLPLAKYTFTKEFKQEKPGDLRLDIHLGQYGDSNPWPAGEKLATYTIHLVSPVTRKFEALTVTPEPEDTPAGSQFTFYATYTSSDNQAPTRVVINLDGQHHDMVRDTSRAGMVYKYTQALAYGTHKFYCRAFDGTTELALSETKSVPSPKDVTPPQLPGAQNQQPLKTNETSVTLSGTASDGESGVALVEWSTNKTQWTKATGTTQWSFELHTGTGDQERKEITVYVRGKDKAGNVTPEAQWWTRKIICDRRHPRVTRTCIARTSSAVDDWAGVRPNLPPHSGEQPLMGEPYYIAFEIENPTDNPVTIRFGWADKSYSIGRRRAGGWLSWPDNMDAPQRWDPRDITIPAGQKIWINVPFQHRWDWIPPQSTGDFLWSLALAYIPVVGTVASAYQLAEWLAECSYAIPMATWYSVQDEVSANVYPCPDTVEVVIKVSSAKVEALQASLCAALGAETCTGCGWLTIMVPVAAAGLFITQAGMIGASYALYQAAYDPDPNFRQAVKVEPFRCPELSQVADEDRERVEAAIHLMEYAKAMYQAYARYLGAMAASDPKWARQQALDAAAYARHAAEQGEILKPLIERAAETIRKATPEQVQQARERLQMGELPHVEIDILKRAGLTDQQISVLRKKSGAVGTALLDKPEVAPRCVDALVESLRRFADEVERETEHQGL